MDRNIGPGASQFQGNRPPDSTAGPGDTCALTGQLRERGGGLWCHFNCADLDRFGSGVALGEGSSVTSASGDSPPREGAQLPQLSAHQKFTEDSKEMNQTVIDFSGHMGII